MGLQESDGDRHQDGEDKHDSKIQKLSRRINYSLLLTKWECRFQKWHN